MCNTVGYMLLCDTNTDRVFMRYLYNLVTWAGLCQGMIHVQVWSSTYPFLKPCVELPTLVGTLTLPCYGR